MSKARCLTLTTDPVLYLAMLTIAMLLGSMPLTLRYAAGHPDVAAAMFTPVGENLLPSASR